jgi:required for meiotic nuclear division protein 1
MLRVIVAILFCTHLLQKATAYCAAEQYNLHIASRLIKADGFDLDPHRTGLYPQVIHVQISTPLSGPSTRLEQTKQQSGDIFIFPSGTVVAWNVLEKVALRLVERVLPPAAVNSHSGFVEIEKEDLEYIEDSTAERCSILGDTIIIGTKSDSRASSGLIERYTDGHRQHSAETFISAPEVDTVLAKIAFSSGLARSTKLAVLERLTDTYFGSTRSIPTILSRGTPLPFNKPRILRRFCEILGLGSRLPFSRPFILRKTGELLSIRAQLNLYNELTDSLPDLFWDSRHELGLEGYYDHVGKALDVGVRIKVLNEKMDYAQEIASVLRETLSERHSLRLEWGIIVLIFIEVVFEFTQRWKEYREKGDEKSTESLLRKYLERAI